MNIRFCDFDMDKALVAPVIYDNKPHCTTNRGVVLSKDVAEELAGFLADFNESVGMGASKPCVLGPYYRIDAYFSETCIYILEINAAFVDGWGTALNLARAANIKADEEKLCFPMEFGCLGRLYQPEFELFISELDIRDCLNPGFCSFDPIPKYVYGRVEEKSDEIFPYDGVRLDNKRNLGLFGRTWRSDLVKVPRHYMAPENSWEEVPPEAVLKFCDKGSKECRRAGPSVFFGKPSGKAPFIKRCYNEQKLLGQELVQPTRQGNKNCQLVILVIGNTPITGYVQYGWEKIINDDSIHGPLMIE
ncbi:MAG: hypothetical protein Q7S10_01085 [bacterium]|nr:hypothetical protein [bacterium]